MDVKAYYDSLIEEDHDPVCDPEPLRAYMDGWDGPQFIDAMELHLGKTVLEIGVGTGRLAVRTAPLCARFYGVDLSPKTVRRAEQNLKQLPNVTLLCGDFLDCAFGETFDVVYSSLTLMHVEQKQVFISKAASLLTATGRLLLSIDKNQEKQLVFGDRSLPLYPDTPDKITAYFENAGLETAEHFETEFAHVFVGIKKAV